MVTTTLPPNTHWKELLQALRIKYQSKAPYDVLMSQFYSTKMDASEDCASFGIRLWHKKTCSKHPGADNLTEEEKKPHKCPHCTKRYTRASDVIRHCKSKHPGI